MTIYKNERYNFIYSQFASHITGALETSIYQQIAKAYTVGAYEGLFNARDGFFDAAIGSADVPGETLAYAARSIDAGLNTLTTGLAGSQNSMKTLGVGAEAIASGNNELAGSLPVLTSGLGSAQSGSAALADGSAQLQSALSEGAESIGRSLHASAEEMGEYIESPTEAVTKTYGELDYYGQGFSPFFMTTALWLGSLLIFFVIEPLAPKADGRGRFKTVLGRLPLYAGMCLLEALTVVAAAYGIGVADAYGSSPLAYGATAFAISFCFMLMMQCLNMVFGLVGKALAVVILILQLACSGGTLPTVLGEGFLATMQPWMPFTYSVDALREVITYCNAGTLLVDLSVLLRMGLVCLACSLLL